MTPTYRRPCFHRGYDALPETRPLNNPLECVLRPDPGFSSPCVACLAPPECDPTATDAIPENGTEPAGKRKEWEYPSRSDGWRRKSASGRGEHSLVLPL